MEPKSLPRFEPTVFSTDRSVIDGPLVFEFVQTLVGLDSVAHGIALRDISSVEAAWGHTEADFFRVGGFVVKLQDGRRAYLHAFCDADTNHHAATVTVAVLSPDEHYHRFAPRTWASGRPIAWEIAPKRLNDILDRVVREI